MHSSIYKHENQINLNKRPVQKNRFIHTNRATQLSWSLQWILNPNSQVYSEMFQFKQIGNFELSRDMEFRVKYDQK